MHVIKCIFVKKNMKNILLVAFSLAVSFVYSQDAISTKGAKVFNSNNQKLSGAEVKSLLSSNTEALKLYSIGKTKQTVGNILLASGFTMVAGKLVFGKKAKSTVSGYYGNIEISTYAPNNYLYYIGAGFMVASIPVLIGHTKKIKKSIELINEDLKNPKTGFTIESSSIIANADGVGISVTF